MESVKTSNAELAQLVQLLSHDITSLSSGTKKYATTARKRLSQISKICTTMRADILTHSKAMGRKKEQPAEPVVSESDEPEPVPPPSPVVAKPKRKPRTSKKLR